MRVETRIIEWFTLAELKAREDRNAYDRARDALDALLWQGDAPREGICEAITYAFAGELKAPGWDTHGEGDFPGVDGVRLDGWDLERGSHVAFTGRLTRDNAPGLPWHEWVESVVLTSGRYGTSVDVEPSDEAPYLSWDKVDPRLQEQLDKMEAAVREALNVALAAGQERGEWYSSEEYLDETAEANGWEFDTNGVMA